MFLNKTIILFFLIFIVIEAGFSGVVLSQNQTQGRVKKDHEYHITLAKEYAQKGKWDEAIEEYTKAISLKPNDACLYYARCITYLNKSVSTYKEGKEDEEVFRSRIIEEFDKIIEIEPDNPVLYFLRGLFSKGKNKEAIKDFDKAISLKSDVALFYYFRGKAYSNMGQYKNAIDDFNNAINLKPDSRQRLYSLIFKPCEEVCYFGSFKEEILKYFAQKLSEFYYSRASAHKKDGQIQKAIKDHEQGILFMYAEGGLSPFTSSLDELYEKENKLNEAIKFYSKVISLSPQEAVLHAKRANFYVKLKQYDKAVRDYTKAIELEPQESLYYSGRGDIYKKLKQYDKAVKDYTKEIELYESLHKDDPLSIAFAYNGRGDVYLKMNQRQKAKADFETACSLTKEEVFCIDLEFFEQEEEELKKAKKRGKNWVWFSDPYNGSFFYDKTRIKTMPNKHIRVWIRKEVKDVNVYVDERKKINLSIKGYEDFSHGLSLEEIDCVSETIGTVFFTDYNNNGNVLNSLDFSDFSKKISKSPIVPGSVIDALYKIVCHGKKK